MSNYLQMASLTFCLIGCGSNTSTTMSTDGGGGFGGMHLSGPHCSSNGGHSCTEYSNLTADLRAKVMQNCPTLVLDGPCDPSVAWIGYCDVSGAVGAGIGTRIYFDNTPQGADGGMIDAPADCMSIGGSWHTQ